MRQSSSGRAPVRPSNRSGPPVYLSLVSAKQTFHDTLLINRVTGVPLYATITQADNTTLYAIDYTMALQKVVTLNWGQGGKPSRTTLTNAIDQTVPLSDISVTSQSAFESLMAKKADRAYSYGRFECKWTEQYQPWAAVGLSLTCYQDSSQHQPDTSLPPVHAPGWPLATSSEPLANRRLATLVARKLPRKPAIQIDVHARDLLRQELGEDGLTDLDHVVLGALLTCMNGGRKRGREPEGWLNEFQLQEQLRSRRPLRLSTETLPLYQTHSSVEGRPPPYSSRISIMSRQSSP